MQIIKPFLLLMIIFLVISCEEEPSKTKADIESSRRAISDNKDIFGSWTMCSTSDGYNMIQMNTCPIVRFNFNGTGSVEKNSLNVENFIWSLKSPGLIITYNDAPQNLTFADTFYYVSFDKRKDKFYLMLRHNEQSYYMSK